MMAVVKSVVKQVCELMDRQPDLTLKQVVSIFHDQKYDTVKSPYYKWKREHKPKVVKPKKKKVIQPQQPQTTNTTPPPPQITTPPLISGDLENDILKVKAVMNMFGDKVRLGEAQSFLKEMGQLKPTREEEIKTSLRKESLDDLATLIFDEWDVVPTVPCAYDSEELETLIGELDI